MKGNLMATSEGRQLLYRAMIRSKGMIQNEDDLRKYFQGVNKKRMEELKAQNAEIKERIEYIKPKSHKLFGIVPLPHLKDK
jgi:hypothetical protein